MDRALQVLEHLGRHPAGLTLLELSSATGVPKPSLHRILASMRARGFAAQLQSGGVYVLWPAALEAAFTFHAKLDLRQLLHPLVLEVNRTFGQTAATPGVRASSPAAPRGTTTANPFATRR